MVCVKKNIFKRYGSILLLLGLIAGCRQPAMVTLSVKPPIDTTEIAAAPLAMPGELQSGTYAGLKNAQAVADFYKRHGFEMVWMRENTSALADSMVSIVKNVRFYGLLPQKYHLTELSTLLILPGDTALYYRKEALLTDAFFSLASDLKYGRLKTVRNQRVIDSLGRVALERTLHKRNIRIVLDSLEPQHRGYQLLKNSLREILTTTDSADRSRLLAGITSDSIQHHKTIQCVEVNLERWRSELKELGDRYVWINIPAYQLTVTESGQSVLESRVIVGKTNTPTPVLTSVIRSISLYPYWNVPRKIAVEELLPSIQRDTSYLRRNNFDVLDKSGLVRNPETIDWKKFNEHNFPFALRQREGTMNSLGIIKFVFENPFAVFLHDTNAKRLFQTKYRALSHGCIRLENPLALARYLVPEAGRIDKLIQRKKQFTIVLNSSIPIYIRYLTSEYRDNALNCYDDVYGLDKPMIKLLYPSDGTNASGL